MGEANTESLIPFSEATRIERLDSHVYRAHLIDSFCIGTVPNGGYVATCLLQAAGMHLAQRTGQKDVLNAHFQFLNRTETGPAIIVIEDVKLGRQLSTLHATLYQHALLPEAPWITAGSTRKEVAAYLTMADLRKERGLSLPTSFITSLQQQHPVAAAAPPRPDFAALKREDGDAHWARYRFPRGSPLAHSRCLRNTVYYDLRGSGGGGGGGGQQPPAARRRTVIDKWVRLASGERFTSASLAFVADCWPYVVEEWRPTEQEAAEAAARSGGEEEESVAVVVPFAPDARFWYPTVVLNLEVKKALPEEGVEWLQLRIQSKQIKQGRFDLEVLILDEEGDLVALSYHVNLILGSERNMAERRRRKEPTSRM
ncbi:thioesterase-like superfamily-domain-containing protein [Chaetomium strumarium]|uniref:Thioesterase-like superfamily-domain-containing protein n=1 Tax=Chaetomium strumarium TaxID=1170767 RepID=A0AAJ0GZX1_9PEZI|nr:thioesterase-like superfamily-domain-containing protein [Chaetomium strumarium]